jgi:flagellin
MSSLLTNMSAMSALQNLSATQKSLQQTQGQISSGLRVASAADNAAYWSISTTMKSDTGALSAVTDALNLGSSTVGVATAGLNSTLTILNQMKQDLVTAQTPGVDITKVQTDIAAQQAQLKSIASSASFNGVNLLSTDSSASGYSATTSIIASFSRSSSGAVTIGTIGINNASTTLMDANTTAASNVGILSKAGAALTALSGAATPDVSADGAASAGGVDKESILGFKLSSTTTAAALTALSTDIDTAIKAATTAGSTLGATKTRIDSQSTFVSALSDAITSGVGSLVDADMNVASTRLQALQTQQQLGIQALSIANQNSQLILKLFGG